MEQASLLLLPTRSWCSVSDLRRTMIHQYSPNRGLSRPQLEYVCIRVQVTGVIDEFTDPAHDLQAMDRAYRFGQTRDVFVYRLLGAGSVEELIYARQVYKQQQMAIGYNASVQTRYFAGVSGDKKRQGELFGLKNIFALHEDNWSTKMAVRRPPLRRKYRVRR